MWKPPGLTAILVPDSNIRAVDTPSYHKQQRQVGVHRLVAMYHVVCGLAPPSDEVADRSIFFIYFCCVICLFDY